MATRLQSPIICECGHTGFLQTKENDLAGWELHSLYGFEGDPLAVDLRHQRSPEDLIAALNPKCPACGETGKVRYA